MTYLLGTILSQASSVAQMNSDSEPPSPLRSLHRQSDEPESTAHDAPSRPGHGLIARSCHACNRKKIRCDKKKPCLSCTRSGKVCSYPPPGPRIRRSKKTIMEEMASRIRTLEESLSKVTEEQAASASAPASSDCGILDTATPAPPQPGRETRRPNLSERSREDVLVQNGSSTQYFNEILLSRVLEEVCHAEVSVMNKPQPGQPGYSPTGKTVTVTVPTVSRVLRVVNLVRRTSDRWHRNETWSPS